jgi:acetyl esterase/lipase
MSLLARPAVAARVARVMQRVVRLAERVPLAGSRISPHDRFPDLPRRTRAITIPTSVAPAPAVVYLPADRPPGDVDGSDGLDGQGAPPPVYVNFHGGGFVLPLTELDDPLCRLLAAEAGVAVVNVDYVVAPQHPFPAAPHQAFEVVKWVAEHGAEQGWDGTRLVVGGQSAGGALAAAVARQALEAGGPPIMLQVVHYAPLDLSTPAADKEAAIDKPVLRPWMANVFDAAYVPDPVRRADPLVSPGGAADTADLTGIAPALVLTAAHDMLRDEGERYAERLRTAGSLVEYHDIPDVDHGYDNDDEETARRVYAWIAGQVRRATAPAPH